LEVMVDTNQTTSLTTTFIVSGGGDLNTNNNSVTDPTSIVGSLDSWKNQWFGSAAGTASAADTNSYAGDGIANLVKYALGMNPTIPVTNGLPEMKMTNNKLSLRFNRQKSATDIVYEVHRRRGICSASATPPSCGRARQIPTPMPAPPRP
ncbi:MAG: hypothetical protein EBZ07_04830, partial [Verrucomicrobia bacterium]|nr:hypothetical protein [Verrucomicrobiota bacterium]